MAEAGCLGPHLRCGLGCLRGRSTDDRQHLDPGSPARVERKKGGLEKGAATASGNDASTRCMGRSRGGLTTKIHALVDACGLPILLKLTEGQAHDGRSAQDMLGSVERGDVLLADAAYDSDALRETLAARGARANIKAMPNRLKPPRLSKPLYRRRNLVERFFNKLKHFRAVATRYDKSDDNYIASVKLASLRIWMRFNESVT